MKAATNGRSSRSSSSRRRRRHSGQSNFSGIHQRRDKRVPLANPKIDPSDILEQNSYCENSESPSSGEKSDNKREWSEAIMLWLSWNRTYEKATARMCKADNKKKLEAMFKEMEMLRTQAIELSQGLLNC